MRTPFTCELGEVDVGDIIIGHVLDIRMEVIHKELNPDKETYKYTCKFIEGPFAGELHELESYMNYRRVN
jgi:hypothetical protein